MPEDNKINLVSKRKTDILDVGHWFGKVCLIFIITVSEFLFFFASNGIFFVQAMIKVIEVLIYNALTLPVWLLDKGALGPLSSPREASKRRWFRWFISPVLFIIEKAMLVLFNAFILIRDGIDRAFKFLQTRILHPVREFLGIILLGKALYKNLLRFPNTLHKLQNAKNKTYQDNVSIVTLPGIQYFIYAIQTVFVVIAFVINNSFDKLYKWVLGPIISSTAYVFECLEIGMGKVFNYWCPFDRFSKGYTVPSNDNMVHSLSFWHHICLIALSPLKLLETVFKVGVHCLERIDDLFVVLFTPTHTEMRIYKQKDRSIGLPSLLVNGIEQPFLLAETVLEPFSKDAIKREKVGKPLDEGYEPVPGSEASNPLHKKS